MLPHAQMVWGDVAACACQNSGPALRDPRAARCAGGPAPYMAARVRPGRRGPGGAGGGRQQRGGRGQQQGGRARRARCRVRTRAACPHLAPPRALGPTGAEGLQLGVAAAWPSPKRNCFLQPKHAPAWRAGRRTDARVSRRSGRRWRWRRCCSAARPSAMRTLPSSSRRASATVSPVLAITGTRQKTSMPDRPCLDAQLLRSTQDCS